MFFLLFLATPIIISPGSNLTGLQHESITLQFEIVYAVPEVMLNDIVWTFTPASEQQAFILQENERIYFEDNLLNMTIFNISEEDAGIYNFTATNRAGTGYASVELIVEGIINL